MLIAAALLLFTLLCITLSDDRAWDNVTRSARNQLVFDGRHQAYGAFQLRREYDRRFILAVVSGIGLLGAGILALWSLAPRSAVDPIPRTIVIDRTLDPLPDIFTVPPEPPAPGPVRPAASSSGAPSIIVVDSTRSLIDTASFTPPTPDPGPTGPTGGTDPALLGGGAGPGSVPGGTGPGPIDTDTLDIGFVEEQPEFPGGISAMHKFIQDNVRWNVEGRGKIYISFVVDADGSVVQVKAKNGNGDALAREAERLVRQMPRWTPAKMNGRPVKCRLVLPISFETRS